MVSWLFSQHQFPKLDNNQRFLPAIYFKKMWPDGWNKTVTFLLLSDLSFRFQPFWWWSFRSGFFLDILKKTQGQKNSRISKNSRDFSKNSRIFSKNSSFCQLLNFEIAAKKKPFFFAASPRLYRAIADWSMKAITQ